MKKILPFVFCCFQLSVFSQQRNHLSQWATHQMAINPAHAGIKKCIDVRGTTRGQWIGVEGAPITGNLTISAPLQMKRVKYLQARHGISGNILYDKIGPFSEYKIQLGYAGHFNFTKDDRLSLGISSGFRQLNFDLSKARPLDPDPVINGSASQLFPTATFGAWFNGKNYFGGLVIYDLIKNNWNQIGNTAKTRMQTVITGGYRLRINQDLTVLPAIYGAYVKNAPIDFQVQAILDIKTKLNIGLGYRNTDALILFIGTNLGDKMKMMYSFDFVLSKLRANSYHSHELTVVFSPCRSYSTQTEGTPLFD